MSAFADTDVEQALILHRALGEIVTVTTEAESYPAHAVIERHTEPTPEAFYARVADSRITVDLLVSEIEGKRPTRTSTVTAENSAVYDVANLIADDGTVASYALRERT